MRCKTLIAWGHGTRPSAPSLTSSSQWQQLKRIKTRPKRKRSDHLKKPKGKDHKLWVQTIVESTATCIWLMHAPTNGNTKSQKSYTGTRVLKFCEFHSQLHPSKSQLMLKQRTYKWYDQSQNKTSGLPAFKIIARMTLPFTIFYSKILLKTSLPSTAELFLLCIKEVETVFGTSFMPDALCCQYLDK